ncbi:hypothetical protein ACTJKN_02425 [Pedobacter sp. 22163]|uniref:hypothetical protein n=1 Tax=Pedobacter sp. 22163 TaxID=3453883 RepID=UPI003F8348A5
MTTRKILPLFSSRFQSLLLAWVGSKILYIYRVILVAAVAAMPILVSAQYAGFNINKSFPSPDVASLGNFATLPSSSFTGQTDVSIPLYNVSYKDLEVPISLAYSTGGNKIDDHPGWVGLGWTLKSGGTIYRKVNGIYDEHPKQLGNTTYTNEICYYYNCGRVADDFGNDLAIGKYTQVGSNAAEIIDNSYDAFPDEFIFNFNGYSGTFFLTRPYHNGPLEIKVKSNGDYKLKAEIVTINSFIEYDDWVDSRTNTVVKSRTDRSIYKLKITDDKGVIYIFGGNPNAIEFSNNGDFTYNFNNIANAWHLTEVISPLGYKIELNYKKAGRVIVQSQQRNALFYDGTYSFGSRLLLLFQNESGSVSYSGTLSRKSFSILSPSYIESIVTPAQTIEFTSSESNQLNYPYATVQDDRQQLESITNPIYKWGATATHWQKLDKINVVGLRQINFDYLDIASRRMQLKGLSVATTASVVKSRYAFFYNSALLPLYNSKMADHWGYYNGRSYAYNDNYMATREPVAAYLPAEMLEKIVYPTGGYLTLQYEPHTYKKIARQFPFLIEDQTENKMAGGLRIRKIVASSLHGALPITKEFFYQKDYAIDGTASSGVLSGIPRYTNTGSARSSTTSGSFWGSSWGSAQVYYGRMSDNNNLPMSDTNGAHVTYSEVTEKSGEGYTVYKYSNQDNGYQDKAPQKTITNYDSQWHEEGFTSMEAFRGLLLNVKALDKEKHAVKETAYEYAVDTTSSYYKVPYFYRNTDNSTGFFMSRVSACLFYTKPPLVKKVEETMYDLAGATSLTTVKETKYFPDKFPLGSAQDDNYKPYEETASTSESSNVLNTYSYAKQFAMATNVYNSMVLANMVAQPIETISYLNRTGESPVCTGASISTYSEEGGKILPLEQLVFSPLDKSPAENNLIATVGAASGLAYDTKYKVRLKYEGSDAYGNPKSIILEDSKRTNYLWSYKGQYPIAEIAEGTYAAIEGMLGEPAITSFNNLTNPDKAAIDNFIAPLRAVSPKLAITTRTFIPSVGIASLTDMKNMTTFYEYDSLQRLSVIKNQNSDIIKTFTYNYGQDSAPEWTDTGVKTCVAVGGVFTGEELIEQVDGNPSSSTFNTTRQVSLGNTGKCVQPTVYARMSQTNLNITTRRRYADIVVSFYSDAACTVPLSVTNLTVSYRMEKYDNLLDPVDSTDYSIVINGTTAVIANQAIIQENSVSGALVNVYHFFLNALPTYTIQ